MDVAVSNAVAAAGGHREVLYAAAAVLIRASRTLSTAAASLRDCLVGGEFTEDAPRFRAHYLLGSALALRGQAKEAAAEYRTTLSLATDYTPAQVALDRVGR